MESGNFQICGDRLPNFVDKVIPAYYSALGDTLGSLGENGQGRCSENVDVSYAVLLELNGTPIATYTDGITYRCWVVKYRL